MQAEIGIIGGSGLYDMAELTDREDVRSTPPSGIRPARTCWRTLRGRRVAFLARHGAGHRISPSELNFREHLRHEGAGRALDPVGQRRRQLKEAYKPLDIVVPDQFYDRTKGRISSFFGRGLVAHVGFAHPICGTLAKVAETPARPWARPSTGAARTCARRGRNFDAGRVTPVPVVGHGHHRHDQSAGGQAGPRSRAALRDTRARHGLRLLASRSRLVTVDMIVATLTQNAQTAQRLIAEAVVNAARRAHVRVRDRPWRPPSSLGPR